MSAKYICGEQDGEVLYISEVSAKPGTPQTGGWKLYSKSDGFHFLDDAGVETKIGTKYWIVKSGGTTSESAYTTLNRWVFPGTTVSDLLVAKIVTTIDADITADFRIYDLTNSEVICEITGQSGADPTIRDLGAIDNLPADEAIFEIQAKRTGGDTSDFITVNDVALKSQMKE